MSEQLYLCPFCKQGKFTSRGLRAHWCKALGGINQGGKVSKNSRPLTREEWAAVVHQPEK